MNRRAIALLDVVGLVLGVVGLAALHARALAAVPYALVGSFQLYWSLVLAALLALFGYMIGSRELPRRRLEVLQSSAGVVVAAVLVVSLSQLVLGSQLLPRSVIGLVALLHPVWSVLVWNLAGDVEERQASRDRILLVAEGDETAALHAELLGRPERPATIVGQLRPADVAATVPAGMSLVRAASVLAPTIVVLDASAQADPEVVAQASELHSSGVRFRTLSRFYEDWLGKLPLSELERASLLFDIGELHRVRYLRAKRVIDLAAGLGGIVVLVPAMIVLTACNRFWNPGPLFFRQERVGKGGVPFEILKFRSMRPDAGDHRTWTTGGDDRVPPFGRILRRSHLDELPQVLNIVRGELSLVGPRPEQIHYVEELRTKLPFYDARHLVRPGLTGWAQVKYGYAGTDADALEKLQYDLFYLCRQGLLFDLRIMVRTLRHLVVGGGR